MKKNQNAIIYPFDVDSVSLIRHSNLIDNYKFVHVVAPNGWGLTGRDAGCVDYGESLGLIVENDFEESLKDCDTVLFVKPNLSLNFKEVIYPKMIKAAESSKNIICALNIKEEDRDIISKICVKNNKVFKYIVNENKKLRSPYNEKILDVDVPVIFVAGLADRTNKFEIQLSLRENLMKMGYKVSQIGTRKYCELMGFHSFPEFMYGKDFYEWEKVVLFNSFVKDIEYTEKPDVIIIGIPGSTLPLNDEFTSKFGILSYEVSRAITPDAVVLGTLYQNKLSDEYFEAISREHKNRFGFNIDCYSISNNMYNSSYSKLLKKIQYIGVDWRFLSEKINEFRETKDISLPIYNILDKEQGKCITEFIVDRLSSYA